MNRTFGLLLALLSMFCATIFGSTLGAAENVKLTVLWRTTPSELETMQQAFRYFEAQNPGIEVELIAAAGSEGDDKLKVMFATGNPPDIFASVFSGALFHYLYEDMLMDLTPYIERENYDLSDFFPGAVENFFLGGRYVGLPRGGMSTHGFYNINMFNEAGVAPPPTSWEDPDWNWNYVTDIAKKLTQQNADGTFAKAGIQFEFWGGGMLNVAPRMWGTSIFPREFFEYGIGTETALTSPLVIESMEKMVQLRLVDEVAPATLPHGGFVGGNVGMRFGGSFASLADASIEWGIMPLPRGRPDIQQRSVTYIGPFNIAKTTKNPDEAWELLKFLVGPEGQRFIAPGATIGTSRLSVIPEYSQLFPQVPQEVFYEVTQGGFRHGENTNNEIADFARVDAIMQRYQTAMFRGEKDVTTALEEMKSAVEPILKEIYDSNIDTLREIFSDFD